MSLTYEHLCEIVGQERVLCDEPMKNHTTFQIGGNADFFVLPDTSEKIGKILKLASEENIPLFVMGNGSNLLVRDRGIRGIVLCIGDNFSEFSISGCKIHAQSGVLLSALAKNILKASLQGFEFASGIPGTLGGAISMNAGAYGGEMKDIVETVTLMDRKGELRTVSAEEMQFAYRKSILTLQPDVVISAVLSLQEGNYDQIKEKMDDFTLRRVSKQPLSACSAGSTFKRPEGYFAGKLIEDAGLKGLQMRGAAVSDIHSGFVINKGEASCNDVLDLISFIKARVYQEFGVQLEEEVKIIGE